MLEIFCAFGQLNMAQLQRVYEQSILEDGKRHYRALPEQLQILRATEDFYDYVDFFLKDEKSMYAVWVADGIYKAALRIEEYCDGYLLSGLETALTERSKGYATALIRSVQEYLSKSGHYKLYSHVNKKNELSLLIHKNSGFICILENAVYIDGSISHNAYTLCYEA